MAESVLVVKSCEEQSQEKGVYEMAIAPIISAMLQVTCPIPVKRTLMATCFVLAVAGAFADWVTDETIEGAATSWLLSDRVAKITMKNLSVARVEHRGALRIVHLSSSGYVVMSGSDAADPVISFSRNDFVEPEELSPFYAMLEYSAEDVNGRENGGGERTSKWTELIGARNSRRTLSTRRLLANEGEVPTAVLIEPFMTMHWNQWQPYNDFSPVWDSDADDQLYRARCACGCVATAAAQQIAHCQWPWRTGRSDIWNHTFNKDGEGEAEDWCPIRFDGHEPFDWDRMLDTYSWWWGDARGMVPESERFPIARLIAWVGVITKMNYGRNGSGANFGNTGDSTTDWYEDWEYIDLNTDYEYGVAKIRADLELGIPVHVGVPGHSVIAHGYAGDGDSNWLYLNYGWGGSSDGWYKICDDSSSSPVNNAFPGFRPRKMVQIDPLPKVSGSNLEVKWHLPRCHDNAVRGFEVTAFAFGDDAGNEICDFSQPGGVASDPKAAYVTNNVEEVDGGTDVLWWESYRSGTYDLPGERLLTSRSVLSYRISSSDVGDRNVEIQASFDGGDWQTISSPFLNRRIWGNHWIAQSVFLGGHAGAIVRFRVNVGWGGGRVLFDDFKCADVVLPVRVFRSTISADLRSCSIGGLDAGKLIGVSVTPVFKDGNGQASVFEYSRIAGRAGIPVTLPIEKYEMHDVAYTRAESGRVWGLRGTAEGESTIKALNAWIGGFDVALPGIVTEASVLSFAWLEIGYYGSDADYDTISATFVDEDNFETEFWTMTNRRRQTEQQRVQISLARFAGKTGGIRIAFSHHGSNYYGDGDIMRFYSPVISNVAIPLLPEVKWKMEEFGVLPSPRIISVTGRDGMEVDEGFYREIAVGKDSLLVVCSETVTTLRAYPSHLSLMNDEDISVTAEGAGNFLIQMDSSRVPRRSRMILTLAATDANGTTTYKDLSLRFDHSSEILKNDRMRKLRAMSGKLPIAAFQFENNMDNTGTGVLIPSIGGGGVSYVESPLGHALRHDHDDGPWTKPVLDFPGNWTILTMAKISGTNDSVLFHFGSSEYDRTGFALASGGPSAVTVSHWMPHSKHVDLIRANVPDAGTKFHAYALRGHGRNIELLVDGTFAGNAVLPTLPEVGFQFFSVIQGNGSTGFVLGSDECVDDWRMYDIALSDAAIVAYANTLLMLDPQKAGLDLRGTVVPEYWYKKYYPKGVLSLSSLSARAANGRSVWECYVAGLDPTDEDDDLVAGISFESGRPNIFIEHGAKPNRTYRILASKTLDKSETPVDVTNVHDLSSKPYDILRFFKILGSLP